MYDPLTSSLLWRAAGVTALIDAPLVLLIAWRVTPALFRALRWYLAGAAAVIWAAIWGVFGSVLFWDEVYHAIFPAWFHWLLPLIYGTLYALFALAFWRVSMEAGRAGPASFLLLGGLISIVGHGIGAARGLFRVPMLANASVASALTFGVFEYIFYWCVIVGLAVAVWKITAWIHGFHGLDRVSRIS